MPSIHVVIATVGRAPVVRRTVDLLADQTRRADGVMIVTVTPDDVAGIENVRGDVQILYSEKGLCRQRNRSMEALEGVADIVVFFDDDFVPASDYLENLEKLFAEYPDVVGVTGELRGDGVGCGGFTVDQALEMLGQPVARIAPMRERDELYGCNMAIRMSAATGMRFDEMLPLYGWQEDVDFTHRLGRKGWQVSLGALTGVHLGVTSGRTPGRRLGYSQIANVVYLKRKGTMRHDLGDRLMVRNLLSNAVRSLWPEPQIDRRGRLLGNLMAIADYVRGRMDPRRILEM